MIQRIVLAFAILALVPAPLGAVPSRLLGGPGFAPPSVADSAAFHTADSVVAAWVASGRVPGAVLRVSQGGQVVLERAYGWARARDFLDGEYGLSAAGRGSTTALRPVVAPTPMTTSTVFDLASVTKVMATTFAVMMLVDRGMLSLDDPVSRHLPDFGEGGKDAITIRHLLTHRSGLLQWVPTYYHATDADGAYAYLRDLPLAWAVGEGRHYSDLGFMVLGRVVEAVAGTGLDAFLQDGLYGPLGLTVTGFRPDGAVRRRVSGGPYAATSHGNPYEHRMVHDSTFGYRIGRDAGRWNRWRRYTLSGEVNDGNAFHAFRGVAGHAGLFSTAREVDALLQLLLHRGEGGGIRVVASEVVDAFLAPTGDGQALGWQVPAYAPAGSFTHTGFTGTWVLGVPARDLSVVLLTNRQNGGVDESGQYPDVGALQTAVARILLDGNGR